MVKEHQTRTRKEIENKIVEISRKLVGTRGGKANHMHGQMEMLHWMLK